jgi:hypothetical protein
MNTDPAALLVVTPTLGDSPYLDQTVASVATLPVPVHHVLSTPAARVTALAARYPGTEVVPDEGRSGGIYGAINAGLRAARPRSEWRWFTYINDDDCLLPGFGPALLGATPGTDVLYGDVDLIDETGALISRITVAKDPRWIPDLLHQGISPLMQQGLALRRETVERLQGFDLRYRLCADLDFWVRAFCGGARFRYHPGPVARFRLRAGQLSADTERTRVEQDEIVARHLPGRGSALSRLTTRSLYRLVNLPRYLERIRARGFRSSYALLQAGTAKAS